MAWGWGWCVYSTATRYGIDTDTGPSVNFYGGVEMPLTNWLSLEGRIGNIWMVEGAHLNFQLSLTLGPNL